ncbi:MAG: Large-conductance mechanosensitive channel protein [Ignavibacteria bacterium]|nr:Large-conductance mechanosensitive channel protein [Ignavibacteria bacterium]
MRGNVLDMAVGVIIGAAFGKIISSLVADIIMPPIGLILGGIDFTTLSIILKPATLTHPAVSIRYGLFINMIIDFLIISFSIFLLVKAINKVKNKIIEEAKEEIKESEEVVLLREIRDLLKR